MCLLSTPLLSLLSLTHLIIGSHLLQHPFRETGYDLLAEGILKLLKSQLMAASATCNFSPCHVGGIRSPLSKPVQCVQPERLALPSRTPTGCQLSTGRVAQSEVTSTSQKVESVFKVFSDDVKGIVCYRSETGEIICEGPDEGPHFYPVSGSNFYMPDTQAAAILPIFGEWMYEI